MTVADIAAEGDEGTVDLIRRAGGRAIFVKTDVASADDVRHMVDRTVHEFGRLDAAFNNAGAPGAWSDVLDTAEADFDRTMALQCQGCLPVHEI